MATNFNHQKGDSDEVKDPSDNYRRFLDNQMDTSADSSSRAATPVANVHGRGAFHARTASDTIRLFQNVVEQDRRQMQESLEGTKIPSTVPLSLTVDLSRKNLEVLPQDIVEIIRENVERIVLSHNQIQALPPGFSDCTNITYLNLRANRFSEFPSALFNLQKIQVLDMSRNFLTELPEELRNMKSLRFLSLMNNRLQNLPYSLGFLESLRVVKLGSNPLNDALRGLMDGEDLSFSPADTSLGGNQKEAIITFKIKQHLKSEATTLESPADSSGEGPLDTPKPLKRASTTLRFPVVPTSAGSDSIFDQRSPSLFKPSVPIRSHYRIPSGQNSVFPRSSGLRPDMAPLLMSNERFRSNSESFIQATQNYRDKRMGITSKQPQGVHPLSELSANRNSLHLRGTSHGSALKERRHRPFKSALGSGSSQSNSPTDEHSRGIFVHRLSSVPEQRRGAVPSSRVIEGARGLLFSLNLIHPTLELLLSLSGDGTAKRSSLEKVYYNAFSHISKLDQELAVYDHVGNHTAKRRKRVIESVHSTSKTCMVVYKQVMTALVQNGPQLLGKADQRYIRMLHYLLSYSAVEVGNANASFRKNSSLSQAPEGARGPVPKITKPPKLTLLPSVPVQRDNAISTAPVQRRYRSETVNSLRNQQTHAKSATNPQSAVPLYLNGRSRSNSRSAPFASLNMSLLANTPRSGESFLIPATPALPGFEGAAQGYPDSYNPSQDSKFEKIYLGFDKAVSLGKNALPQVIMQFNHRLNEVVQYGSKAHVDLWNRLLTRAHQCRNMCEALCARLSTIKLKDPEIRNSRDFWRHVTRYINSFVTLVDALRTETARNRQELSKVDAQRLLKPIHVYIKAATNDIRASPWAYVLDSNSPPPTAISTSSPNWPSGSGGGSYMSPNTGQLSANRANGHYRAKQGDSLSSPYLPTTPLSAALGPAAQATVPSSATSTSSMATIFDRSFHGDVFQRADQLLNTQPGLRDGRR